MTIRRQNGSTTRPFNFLLVDAADHISALTGATPSISISKNGGAFAAASGAITELANGWYSWAGNATDRNTNGELVIHVTATGADPFDGKIEIVPWDPFDAAALGLTNLNATVSSRAVPGDAMTLSANAVSAAAIASGAITAAKFAADAIDATALATSAANEIRDAILTDATRFAGANIDAAVSSRATNAGAAAAVWDEARAGHVTAGTFGQGVASVVGSVGSVATGGITAGSFAASAIDSAALATTAVNEIRDSILSDSTPFQGARIDATISSRATDAGAAAAVWDEVRASHVTAGTFGQGVASVQGNVTGSTASIGAGGIAAAAFAANAIDSSALATSAVNEIRDSILSDSTPFQGARIDGTITSRASQTSVDTVSAALVEASLTVGTGSSTTVVNTDATQATGFYDGMIIVFRNAAGNVARAVTSYSSTNGAFTVSALPFTPSNGDSVYVIGNVSASAGSAPTVSQIVNGVWDEPRASHTTAGTFGQGAASVQGNVTGSVASIGAGGIAAAAFAANAIDSSALATTAVNEIRDSILSDSTPFQGGRIDAAVSSRATNAAAAAAVWDEARAGHVTAGTFGQGVASVSGAVGSVAPGGITATSFAADAIDSAALAATAVNEIRDAIISDATPFQGARIDAAISSRATNAGAAAAVWDEPRASHVVAGSFGEGVASVATGGITSGSFAAGAINAAAIGAAALTAAKFATDAIDANALAASAANEVRDTILSDATPFQGARIDATISSRASQTSVTALSNATIAATLVAAAGSSTTSVRTNATQATGFFDGMTVVVVNAAGTAARQVTAYDNANGAFTVSALPFTPAASDAVFVIARPAASGLTAGQVSAAVWDEPRASHATAGTFGEGSNVVSLAADTITATALAASATAEIDTVLTAAHGAGSWQSGGGGGSSTRVQTNVTFDASTNTLRVNAWLEGSGGAITTGASNGTFRLYDAAGTALTALQTDAAPDANGVFYWSVAAPTFLVGETATYVRTSIEYLSVVYEGVTGVTFSRST